MIHPDIPAYNAKWTETEKAVCDAVAFAISDALPEAESKIWHAHPVWFLEGNPIVGYSVLKNGVRLLFWSGRSFDEEALKPEGSFQAAEIRYTKPEQIELTVLNRWLQKGREIQWDYKNIVKRKGVLVQLK